MIDPRYGADDEDELDAEGDDAIIGSAFRWSVIVMAGVAVLVLLAVLVFDREPPEVTVVEAPLAGPVETTPVADAEPPAVPWIDVTAASGIEFVHSNGAYGERFLPETMGSGAAFFDYDNDGDPDLLLVNSTSWPWQDAADPAPTMRLYANRGDGHFDDVTRAAGLDITLYGTGVAVGDYDADGYKDVFVMAVGPNLLLRNVSGERFEAVAGAAAGADDDWSTSGAFFDYDGDGDLDLFVVNYVEWSREIDFDVDYRLDGIGRAYGPPTNYGGTDSRLYRNDDGRFVEYSGSAGIRVPNPATGKPMGKGLALTLLDVDDNGLIDVMVANDTVQNFLFVNRGEGRFEELGAMFGVAFDTSGAATGAMGVDAGRYANDADVGIAVGNFANEMTSFYVAQSGSGLFTDESIVAGIGAASRRALSFGLFFFDYDLDGRLDLLQVNGHVEDEINSVQPSQQFEQPAQLFWNCADACRRRFVPVEGPQLGDLARPAVGRGATYADIDADGDLDVLVTQAGRAPRLLRNDQALGNHWLRVVLRQPGPNRDAIGARVALTAGGVDQYRFHTPARSYLSQVEFPITFGLGGETSADIDVHWPDGTRERFAGLAADRVHTLERGQGQP